MKPVFGVVVMIDFKFVVPLQGVEQSQLYAGWLHCTACGRCRVLDSKHDMTSEY